jgi:L-gulono-1,4-lactone dehydrogenase
LSLIWRNHAGNQSCRPLKIVQPGSLQELIDLVKRAEREGTTVRAVGAGHAWSDIALTDGYLIEPDRLSGVTRPDESGLREGARGRDLVRVLGGTHIHTLNDELDGMNLALPNMGGYDAQTIAGVVSTSTHGSGLRWGPFPDLVRSLDLVVAGGEALRLEPSDGPTDPAAFADETLRLVQDDRQFAAAVCGLGTTGLIHSLVLEVREKFWLNEVRTLSTWEEVRETLTEDGVLGEGDHYELFLNPYPQDDGRHRVLVTRRRDCPEPHDLPPDKGERHPLTELEASLPPVWFVLRFLARHLPSLMVKRFDSVLDEMQDDGYADVSYKVFNIGEANHLPAYSMELCIALEGGRHIEAVDRMIEIARLRAEEGIYHSSPVSLRFVAPSGAYASMAYGQATMIIELIMVTGSRGGYALLEGYEDQLAELGARPHWGQYNTLTGDSVRRLYPKWEDWLEVERQFNSSGVFDSIFTRRVGISPPATTTQEPHDAI